jgi:large subunit ribosomal protein L22
MEAKATAKYLRVSPRKARRVIELIRGRQVDDARRVLKFSPLGATDPVVKVLDSAVANAERQPGIISDNLIVDRAFVDEGPTLKRFRPRAYGRAGRIRRRTSHITLVVRSLGEDAGGPQG